jgi:aryl-alcohol dehydrogenase-like predicted oxidoreductase
MHCAGWTASVFIQVKFGGQRDPSGAFIGHDASPVAVKNSLAYTLTRLGTDYVDLYQPARLDQRVPIEDTFGAITELIQAGYARYLGLSEVGVDTIRRAAAVHKVTALQIEYSLMSRGIEASVLPTIRDLGIGVTAYGIIPLIGTKRRDRLAEALRALELTMTPGELAAIEAAVPSSAVAGDRYDAAQMRALDSEKH